MEEINGMARELLTERIRIIRADFAKGQPEDRRSKSKTQMEQMEAILQSLPDGEREWLDNHLMDGMLVSEDECTALYLAGLKDGLHLLRLAAT